VIAIGTRIPRAKLFRFENYWHQHSSFTDIVKNAWNILVNFTNSAKRINAKFKNVRRALKIWSKNLPCMKKRIEKVNSVIDMLDTFEEVRALNDYE
jgi:hypothetical protein